MPEFRGFVFAACFGVACASPAPPAGNVATVQSAASTTPAPIPLPAPPTSDALAAVAPSGSTAARPPVQTLASEAIALPGASAPVSLDYLFFEPERARVWVPAGGSASVDVFDIAAHSFTRVEGFKTAEREAHGKTRLLGPSSGAIGDGFAYVGNRATGELCTVDLDTLKIASCAKLSAAPDGVCFVTPTNELWVTAPSRKSILVLQPSQAGVLRETAVIQLKGEPEGYAVDAKRGLFLTNLEDAGTTLAIDLQSHAVKAEWHASCGSDGPRGIAVDARRGLVMVACTDHVQVLGAAGAPLGKLETGAGVDNLDYVESSQLLYAAAGKAARLTVARLADDGQLATIATGQTAPGARNAVADGSGNAYVADPQGAHLLLSLAKH
jgi:hypothetical protein